MRSTLPPSVTPPNGPSPKPGRDRHGGAHGVAVVVLSLQVLDVNPKLRSSGSICTFVAPAGSKGGGMPRPESSQATHSVRDRQTVRAWRHDSCPSHKFLGLDLVGHEGVACGSASQLRHGGVRAASGSQSSRGQGGDLRGWENDPKRIRTEHRQAIFGLLHIPHSN